MIAVDLVTLPILTIYRCECHTFLAYHVTHFFLSLFLSIRGGESMQVLAGIAHDLGEYFSKEDIEWQAAYPSLSHQVKLISFDMPGC